MEQSTYEDAKTAVMASYSDPNDVPEMCFPEMRDWLMNGPAAQPPAGTAEWLRDREDIWDRASRVVEKMAASMPAPGDPLPEWFGSRQSMLVRFPWASELGWAVEEMERMLG